MKTVHQLGEFGLIRHIQGRLRRPDASVLVGIGDDCAVLRSTGTSRRLLYTCDPVVEGSHYQPGTPPRQIGWKAMARNLSDIAAMGGQPRWAVVSIGLRPTTAVRYVDGLYTGLQAAAGKFGCAIVGGDTTHVRHEQFIVITLLGEVDKTHLTLRRGAKPGDAVFVTGTLGGSLRGKHLKFTPRLTEARWLVNHFTLHAMIDLSDGLSNDLQRLIEANQSRIGFDIVAGRVPISRAARGSLDAALHDGEDFELLFTVAARDAAALRAKWRRRFALPLTAIGRVTRNPGKVQLLHPTGPATTLQPRGYDHFATPSGICNHV